MRDWVDDNLENREKDLEDKLFLRDKKNEKGNPIIIVASSLDDDDTSSDLGSNKST